MESQPTVRWWQRLLLGFIATIIAWFSSAIVLTCYWLWRTPQERHWFTNFSRDGILAILREALVIGGFLALDFYVLLAIPLILLWPVKSQLKHWYAFLGAAFSLPLVLTSTLFWRHPLLFLQEVLHNPGILELSWPAMPFVFGIACYLLLLRRRSRLIVTGN
jgi:hypothetical protein